MVFVLKIIYFIFHFLPHKGYYLWYGYCFMLKKRRSYSFSSRGIDLKNIKVILLRVGQFYCKNSIRTLNNMMFFFFCFFNFRKNSICFKNKWTCIYWSSSNIYKSPGPLYIMHTNHLSKLCSIFWFFKSFSKTFQITLHGYYIYI